MHPLLAGRLRIALYLALWVGIGIVLSALLALLGRRPLGQAVVFVGPLILAYAFACLSAWWVCRAYPLGSVSPWKLAGVLLGATVQSSAAWTAIGALWAVILSKWAGMAPGPSGLPRDLAVLFVAGAILYSQSIVVHYLLAAFESARAAERRLLESQVAAREAELKALRAQLNPHFLFNSLNSISALVGPDPEAARNMCQMLGEFLRASLSLGARERVALAEELALAERYLAIERVRFGTRLVVERRAEPAAERCQVPPLLIQPLVENAVKHGVADSVEGGTVRIEARRRAGTLQVSVENPFDPDAPPRRGQGLGLENVRRRLAALDPRATRVDVVRDGQRFRVTLFLPAAEAAVAPAPDGPAESPAPATSGGGRMNEA